MTRIVRTLMLAAVFLGLATGTAAAGTAQGVGCSSTRACTTSAGGALIQAGSHLCSTGLPVRDRAGHWYMVTAGHCVAEGGRTTWRQSGVAIGKGTRWEYGGRGTEGPRATGDIGLIKLSAASRSRVVAVTGRARIQPIVAVKDAKLGEKVCATAGRTGRTQCGRVVATNTSLRYASPGLPARTITGLAMVSGICVNPGDSGSPVFAGRAAIGITVAKSNSGCAMWYSKLPAQLKHFGLYVQG